MLSAKVVLILVRGISSHEYVRADVSEEYRLVGTNDLALEFEALVRVHMVQNPDTLVALLGGHGDTLLVANSRGHSTSLRVTGQTKLLTVEVAVGGKAHLLAIANVLVRAEDVLLVDALDLEHRASHGAGVLALAGRGYAESLEHVGYLFANVDDEPALGCSILDHHLVAPAEVAVGRVSPGHLTVGALILGESLCKGERIAILLSLIVGLLNGSKLEVFVPVANARLVRILGAAL